MSIFVHKKEHFCKNLHNKADLYSFLKNYRPVLSCKFSHFHRAELFVTLFLPHNINYVVAERKEGDYEGVSKVSGKLAMKGGFSRQTVSQM